MMRKLILIACAAVVGTLQPAVAATPINYLLIDFSNVANATVGLSTTCPSSHVIHRFGVNDAAAGFSSGSSPGGDQYAGTFGAGYWNMSAARVCIAGAPATLTVNTPLSVNPGSEVAATASTTLAVAGPTTSVVLAPWYSSNYNGGACRAVAIALPDGFAVFNAVNGAYYTLGYGLTTVAHIGQDYQSYKFSATISLAGNAANNFPIIDGRFGGVTQNSRPWYIAGAFCASFFNLYTIGY